MTNSGSLEGTLLARLGSRRRGERGLSQWVPTEAVMAQRAAASRLKNERTERWLVSTLGQPLLDCCRQCAANRKENPDLDNDSDELNGALEEALRRNRLPVQHTNPALGFVLTQYYYLVALAAFNAAKSDGSS